MTGSRPLCFLSKLAGILCTLAIYAACSDPERVFTETLEGFDTFFMLYADLGRHPRQQKINRDMVNFLETRRVSLAKGLDAILRMRAKKPAQFQELYEKNRAGIVSSFRRLDTIDKREKMIFSVFSLVFAPDDEGFDPAGYPLQRDMLTQYLEVILLESRSVLM
ncbi:MAG: hypothetical protein LBC99_06365 [Spirochaetota bacterium]|nr:hypothetical protein [Spirochaetota bacterium]